MAFRIVLVEDEARMKGIVQNELPRVLHSLDERVISWVDEWPSHKGIKFEVQSVQVPVPARRKRLNLDEIEADLLREKPDLVVLDMALSEAERDELDENGGTDDTGRSVPEQALRKTSGFQLLLRLRRRCPVVVTTYASNPRVRKLCFESGAYAVVLKPFQEADMLFSYSIFVTGRGTPEQRKEARDMIPQMDTYVLALAIEVLKGLREVALTRLSGHAPLQVPYWLAAEQDVLAVTNLTETNLMLLDVRGFSSMAEKLRANPKVIFDLMNSVWEEVVAVVRAYGGDVNSFIGDAALVFFGVYPYRDASIQGADIRKTIECARDIVGAFGRDGPVRQRLLDVVDAECSHPAAIQDGLYDSLQAQITSKLFGARVVMCAPDPSEAVYGKVGSTSRWQHTILSRFMNALARVESAISAEEKRKSRKIVRGWAEPYLLWPRHAHAAPLPLDDRWRFRRVALDVRDVPPDHSVFRILPPLSTVAGAGVGELLEGE